MVEIRVFMFAQMILKLLKLKEKEDGRDVEEISLRR